MRLTDRDRALLGGADGDATRIAMELLVAVGESQDAPFLVDIESAHVDACLFHGYAGLDFAEALVEGSGQVRVPTTLNVTSLDLLHPELYRGDPETANASRRLMEAYVDLGCTPTWTCAPYLISHRPGLGAQVAWGESNAIVFANSVLGARTNRYGDFMDICCALTGRAPYSGLHTDEGRLASLRVDVDVPSRVLANDALYPLLGHILGQLAGNDVAVITGLAPDTNEDQLRALGAAAASSGAVGMFHVAGVTPEAGTLEEATGDRSPKRTVRIGSSSIARAREELTTSNGPLTAVSVGTPHMSLGEFRALASLTDGRVSRMPFYVNTSREILELAEAEGLVSTLQAFGATVVTDTCTYVTPIIDDVSGTVMTNSGKWAFYAPANLGVGVVFGSLPDCVESAVSGAPSVSGDFS